MNNGLVVMLEMAGNTIATLQDQLAEADRLRDEQEATIAHLRERLIEARTSEPS